MALTLQTKKAARISANRQFYDTDPYFMEDKAKFWPPGFPRFSMTKMLGNKAFEANRGRKYVEVIKTVAIPA